MKDFYSNRRKVGEQPVKNNIFEYATSELSQDAFICWCANWFNDDSKPRLREMSVELMKHFAGVDEVKSVSILRQYKFGKDVFIESNKFKRNRIDVLLIVNNSIAVIVEDKTYTGEHDNQIQRYADGIRFLVENAKENEIFYGIKDVRTVFLKTGFMYDEDRYVKSDVVVSGEDFLKILSKYEGNSEILDSYIANLKNNLQWHADVGNYEDTKNSFWEWNIAKHHIAQYRLMRDIFPESLWTDRNSWLYKVYHGTSVGGSHWTQMRIYEKNYTDSSTDLLFWRIDTSGDEPYISLRLYNENNAVQKDRHKNLYESMSRIMKDIIEEGNYYQWIDVYPGYRGNYKESSIIHIKLSDKLTHWSEERAEFIEVIHQITNKFLERISKIDL